MKKILGVLVIVGCSGIFLNGYVGVGEAHAQEQTATDTDTSSNSSFDTMGLWQILDMVLKLIYVLLWPLLVIAGLALDNTLVYASVFHMDAPLWKFWNMMKNFANFALGFMVLFAIIKSILTNSGQGSMKDAKTPLGIIKTTLIAGVLIQASRFLVAATVDISTVATYAVGGLPLSVLKNTDIGNKKILSVSSSVDLNKFDILSEEGENFKVWYSTHYKDGDEIKKVELSPCRIEEGYIVGRQYKEAKFRNDNIFGSGQSACVAFGNQIVIYNENPNVANKNGIAYKQEVDYFLNIQDDRKPRESCGYIIKVGGKTSNLGTCGSEFEEILQEAIALNNDHYDEQMSWLADNIKPTNTNSDSLGLSAGTTRFDSDNVIATTMSELIKGSKGFVGPLVTIYSSLLNFAQLTDTSTTSIGETSGVFIIKTLVAVALFFPLLALAVVLIMRIGVLRLYIVASPFIVLKACFKDFIKMDKLDKYLDIKGVMGIIFAPVVTVAALSISLIFMTALVNGLSVSSSQEDIHKTLGTQMVQPIHTGNNAVGIAGVAEVEFTQLPWGDAMDWFSRLMVNFFAIGLMWMIVFAAIKANEIGKGAGQKIQDFGQNFFQTLPILPIGEGGSKVGIKSASKVLGEAPDTWIRQRESQQTAKASDFVRGTSGGTTPTTIDTTWAKSLITENSTKESIQKGLKEKGVEETNMGAVLTSSYASLYDAVQALPEDKRASLITVIAEAGAGKDRDKTYLTAKAKTDLDTFVTSKNPTDKNTLSTIFTNANDSDKKIIENHLTKTGDTYTTTVAGTEYTVKRTDTGTPPVTSYSVTP